MRWHLKAEQRKLLTNMSLEDIPTMTKDETKNQGHTVLYKGVPGSGKTYNILSWPQPIVVAYFDENLLTLRQAMDSGVDVKPYFCKDWHQFYDEFVPAIVHREVEAKTIAIDTLDPLGIMIQRDIQGTKPKFSQPDFGILLNRWIDVMSQLVSCTKHKDGKPGYNFVAAVHLKDITNEGGTLVRIAPQIMGTFRDILEQFFDWVLLCEAKAEVKGNSPPKKVFTVRSIPHTSHHTCKGGDLPAVCSGEYKELMKHSRKAREAGE